MFQQSWSAPVVVRLRSNVRIVRTTSQATECLTDEWPAPRSKPYDVALQACVDCFEGHMPTEQVRRIFIAACSDAGILIKP
ncbi:MAG: DUF982 domain-containing protein [Rhizobiaceae bacterium]|nr:DUF982 domain-containing protein [Rhizobiaceae bacterium]